MIDLAAEAKASRRRAFPVLIVEDERAANEAPAQVEELYELIRSAECIPLECEIVRSRSGHPKYLMGSGNAEMIARLAQECEADCLVFDTSLSPSQQRNWERLAKCPVIDREELILDIFAARARSREAVLQVELARAQFMLPRLTGAWGHLSRQQGGGATTRGEGEAQIEVDRRLLRRRIGQLRGELEELTRQRGTQRKARRRRPVSQGAIVGYTNVGKSSLLRALTGADVLVRDQLFATLDPSSRRMADFPDVVLSDTVGFVRRLPHSLIEAFKSTLEEAAQSDFLLLVLDISSPQLDMEFETTLGVLKELGADEKNIQIVFNKCDLIDPERDAVELARLRSMFPDAVYISTRRGDGLDELRARIGVLSSGARGTVHVMLPPSRHDLVALAHRFGEVYEETYTPEGDIEMRFAIVKKYQHKYAEFEI